MKVFLALVGDTMTVAVEKKVRVCHTCKLFLLCLAGMGSDDLLNMGQGPPPPPSPGSIPRPGSLGGGSQVGARSEYYLRLLAFYFSLFLLW